MISVVTVTFNASTFIETTIQSVCSQKNRNFEFLLIDGASRDDTVAKVKQILSDGHFPMSHVTIVSERDRGMVDAMNKGVGLSKGDYVLFLNGGDSFYDEKVIDELENSIANNPADAIYGRTMMLFYEGRGIYNENEEHGDPIMPFIHQSVIVRREHLLAHPFDLSYKVLGDREFFFWMRRQHMTFHFEPYIVSTYDAREGGSENNPYIVAVEGDRIVGKSSKWRTLRWRLTKAPIQPIKNWAPRWLLNFYFYRKRKNIDWVEKY
ncbi:MAG: glycosyltransferase [Bacteroidales bacterium]|nr:glycosyltransferase [Bacteroidales bacterium]